MSSNNKIENLSFNPRDLSRDDLLKLIELNPNANDEEITEKIQNLLEDQDDPSIINFLYLSIYICSFRGTLEIVHLCALLNYLYFIM